MIHWKRFCVSECTINLYWRKIRVIWAWLAGWLVDAFFPNKASALKWFNLTEIRPHHYTTWPDIKVILESQKSKSQTCLKWELLCFWFLDTNFQKSEHFCLDFRLILTKHVSENWTLCSVFMQCAWTLKCLETGQLKSVWNPYQLQSQTLIEQSCQNRCLKK